MVASLGTSGRFSNPSFLTVIFYVVFVMLQDADDLIGCH